MFLKFFCTDPNPKVSIGAQGLKPFSLVIDNVSIIVSNLKRYKNCALSICKRILNVFLTFDPATLCKSQWFCWIK